MGAVGRAVANPEWISLFLGSTVIHIESVFSNHKPIIIHPKGIQIRKQTMEVRIGLVERRDVPYYSGINLVPFNFLLLSNVCGGSKFEELPN